MASSDLQKGRAGGRCLEALGQSVAADAREMGAAPSIERRHPRVRHISCSPEQPLATIKVAVRQKGGSPEQPFARTATIKVSAYSQPCAAPHKCATIHLWHVSRSTHSCVGSNLNSELS